MLWFNNIDLQSRTQTKRTLGEETFQREIMGGLINGITLCQNIKVMTKIGLSVYCQNMYRMRKGFCPSKCVYKKNSLHFVNIAASLTENLLWGIERVVSAIFIPFLNSKVDHSCSLIISNCHSSIVDSEMKLSYLQIGRGWTGKFFFFTNNKHLIRFCKNEENQKIF